jgi:hypothetical protein
MPPGYISLAQVACAPNEKLVGGGFATARNNGAQVELIKSEPFIDGTKWVVMVENAGATGTVTATAVALCAAP